MRSEDKTALKIYSNGFEKSYGSSVPIGDSLFSKSHTCPVGCPRNPYTLHWHKYKKCDVHPKDNSGAFNQENLDLIKAASATRDRELYYSLSGNRPILSFFKRWQTKYYKIIAILKGYE